MKKTISIISPIYNEEGNIVNFYLEVSNVATTDGLWGRFMLRDSGGDAVR